MEEYKVKIYPELIVLSEVGEGEDLDLFIANDNLSEQACSILNLLEVVIYKQTKRHLFGVKAVEPIVNYNPNKMNKKQYKGTIKKALRFLKVI